MSGSPRHERPARGGAGAARDLTSVLGQANAFIGFTSGTGSAGADHDIVDWTFTNRFAPIGAVPEPASMALVGLGLAAGVMHRRRKRNAA